MPSLHQQTMKALSPTTKDIHSWPSLQSVETLRPRHVDPSGRPDQGLSPRRRFRPEASEFPTFGVTNPLTWSCSFLDSARSKTNNGEHL